LLQDPPQYTPSRSGEQRAEVEELVSNLLGSTRDGAEATENRRTSRHRPSQVPSANGTAKSPKLQTHSVSTQTFSATPTSTVFEVAPDTRPRRDYITYSKGVQTDAIATEFDQGHKDLKPDAESFVRKSQSPDNDGKDEEIRGRLLREIEEELKATLKSKSADPSSTSQQRYPLRTLTLDEVNAVTSSDDFLSFVERSSRVIERALDDDYDVLADYTTADNQENGASDEDGFSYSNASRKPYALRQTQQFFDLNQSRRRQVSDLQFSYQFPELLLSSYTKASAVANDPSGLIMLWNVHAPSRPEYTFHCQGADILSARFSPFHPHLIIGGCYTGQVCLWDTRAMSRSGGAPVLKTPQSGSHLGHNHPVYSISIIGTPNAHNILTASSDGVVCSWSVDMLTQPQEYLELTTPPPSRTEDLAPTCMAYPASDPTFFVVGTEEGTIYPCHRYDRAGAKAGVDTKIAYKGHTAPVMSTHFHPAKGPVDLSDLLLTSSVDWSVKLWRIRPTASSSSVAANAGSTNTAGGSGGPQSTGPVLDISREDLVYDAKWAPHKPSVFACVTGAGDLEIFDLNVDLEVPVTKATPSRGKGGSLATGLNKCAWENKGGGLVATGGLDGIVTLFEVGNALSGEARADEWTAVKKAISRAESGRL
jgi:dynein intermediate chain, cytosolic